MFGATISASANFSAQLDGTTNSFAVAFTNTLYMQSTELERDPTSWVHFVISYDSGNATASNRCRVWKNGSEITSWSTDNRASIGTANDAWNTNALLHYIGSSNASYKNDDYKARIAFVDGTSVTDATSFGYLNTEINEWVSKSQSAVKAVVDAGGTNSFMLDFDDATSLTTLGYDKSSKGNNWTLNNFSLTAGTSYDRMLDVPGNSFAIYAPIDQSLTSESDGNLKVTTNVGGYSGACRASLAIPTTGKWFWETSITANGGSAGQAPVTGIMATSSRIVTAGWSCYGYYGATGNKQQYVSGSLSVDTGYGPTYTVGDIIGVAYDADAGTLTFYKNGVSQGQAFSGIAGEHKPVLWDAATGGSAVGNFGQYPFATGATYDSAAGGYFRYTPPTGYKALCQRNMPDPAILNPEKHFDVVTRTGTAATYSVAGLGFQPDLVWVKSRGRAVDHALYDSVRGVQKQLESNQTGAETTESTGLTAFNSGGYTGGALDQINGTTATNSFVDWLWKAGGAAVTNNAGSISSQVSANVEAGFSIVTYTGTGANAAVGHGLGKALGMVIVKNRIIVSDWITWHNTFAGTDYILLDTTGTKQTLAAVWNSTVPSSTVFSVGTNTNTNGNTNGLVAYCFAEIPGFSKIFSYTGNGSADGPFVHCGFKPKFVLTKRVDSTGDWLIFDAVRNTYNVMNLYVGANLSSAEFSDGALDTTANGFKWRTTGASANASGGTYIGIAFADVTAKYSLAR